MRKTGYTAERAAPHELAVAAVLAELRRLGIDCHELPVDGHKPDAQLAGESDYIEVKTSSGSPNLAIELDSIQAYRHIEATEPRRVYIVWPKTRNPKTWTVHTVDSLVQDIDGGPRIHSGSGSNDDWYLFKSPAGTPFVEFFL